MATLQQRESIYRNKIIDKFNNEDLKLLVFKEVKISSNKKQLDKILVQRLSQEGVEFSNSKSLESQVD